MPVAKDLLLYIHNARNNQIIGSRLTYGILK
jgi:hypothetical protein